MKKFLTVMASASFLALASASGIPPALAACSYSVDNAKADVAQWDKNATWESLTSGPKFDKLAAYAKVQLRGLVPEYVSILIVETKQGVIFGLVTKDQCITGATSWRMTKTQFELILGGAAL